MENGGQCHHISLVVMEHDNEAEIIFFSLDFLQFSDLNPTINSN